MGKASFNEINRESDTHFHCSIHISISVVPNSQWKVSPKVSISWDEECHPTPLPLLQSLPKLCRVDLSPLQFGADKRRHPPKSWFKGKGRCNLSHSHGATHLNICSTNSDSLMGWSLYSKHLPARRVTSSRESGFLWSLLWRHRLGEEIGLGFGYWELWCLFL